MKVRESSEIRSARRYVLLILRWTVVAIACLVALYVVFVVVVLLGGLLHFWSLSTR